MQAAIGQYSWSSIGAAEAHEPLAKDAARQSFIGAQFTACRHDVPKVLELHQCPALVPTSLHLRIGRESTPTDAAIEMRFPLFNLYNSSL